MLKIEKLNGRTVKVAGRIDTTNAAQADAELKALCVGAGNVLDFEALDYISSAGLRVLLKLRKADSEMKIINASADVYDIFETTGFAELIDIRRAYRKIDVTGLEVIGKGGTGTVYRLNDETIVKVFREGISLEQIEAERNYAQAAFVAGVPTAIPFDVVKVGDAFGNVYELMNSDTLANAIKKHPERYEELMDKYCALVKSLENTHVKKDVFTSYKDLMMERFERVADLFGEENAAVTREILGCMRETDTLIHGDLHPGNIMLQGDELMLIDMADLTTGSPIWEMVALYRDLGLERTGDLAKFLENSIGLDRDRIKTVWNSLIRRYYGTEDEAQLEKNIGMLKLLYYFITVPLMSMATPEQVQASLPRVRDMLLEKVVKPQKETLKYLAATL